MLYLGTTTAGKKIKATFTIESNETIILGNVENIETTTVIIRDDAENSRKKYVTIELTTPGHSGNYVVKIAIPIKNPTGWKPLEFILQGQVRMPENSE
ncbi:hypothetical protein SDC9_191886 [bioreactor metagenome]|uniref:DUF4469 domain-containing protein n=1 Tax=bioreactor metagenome TaxID=1076179 RepID=A0A645I7E7_9ZZZZ